MTEKQRAIHTTHVKAGAESMLHMRHAMTVGKEDTPAMRWGRLVHLAVLEPLKVAALPRWDGDRRGKEWSKFKAELADREDYLLSSELEKLEAITAATRKATGTLPRITDTEVSVRWEDDLYGRAGTRVDGVSAGNAIIELKTSQTVEERAWRASAERMGYRLQFGWSWHGVSRTLADGFHPAFFVVVVESKPPHETRVEEVPLAVLKEGYEDARQIALAYRACEACDCYPGRYEDGILQFERPAWTQPADIDMAGIEEE